MLRGKSPARISRSVQRYFPQCVACCSKQAGAVKSSATRLVFHYYGMRPWYYAGEAHCCCCQCLASTVRISRAPPANISLPLLYGCCACSLTGLSSQRSSAGAFVGLRQYCNPAILQQKRRG